MNSNTIKTYALIGTSLVSVALLYRNVYLAGLLVGMQRARDKAVDSAIEYSCGDYLNMINQLQEACEVQETPQDDPMAILDIVNSFN